MPSPSWGASSGMDAGARSSETGIYLPQSGQARHQSSHRFHQSGSNTGDQPPTLTVELTVVVLFPLLAHEIVVDG